MAAFSRGLLLQAQCLRATPKTFVPRFFTAQLTPRVSTPRPFSTSQLLQLAAKKIRGATPKSPQPKAKPTSSHASTPAFGSYSTFISNLASKSHPTLLYQAPSHRLYIISAYLAGACCLAYAIWNVNNVVLKPPEGLYKWIPYAFGVICFLTACLGCWFILAPSGIIRSISAVPTIATGTAARSLRLEIELLRTPPLPFLPAKRIVVLPTETSLNFPLHTPVSRADQRRMELSNMDKAWQQKSRGKSILTLPFRQMSLGFHKLVSATSRLFTRAGFLKLDAKGLTYKLDITGGWALDEGKALDKLVRVKLGAR
jgi:hypothetical protein